MKDKLVSARERAQKRDPPQDVWPVSQKLTDVLRCTLDCVNPVVLLQTWELLKKAFVLETGNGGLQNKFLKKGQPLQNVTKNDFPNLHAQPVFVVEKFNYKIVVEVQLHLRDIFKLKDAFHAPYDIIRTNSASELGN